MSNASTNFCVESQHRFPVLFLLPCSILNLQKDIINEVSMDWIWTTQCVQLAIKSKPSMAQPLFTEKYTNVNFAILKLDLENVNWRHIYGEFTPLKNHLHVIFASLQVHQSQGFTVNDLSSSSVYHFLKNKRFQIQTLMSNRWGNTFHVFTSKAETLNVHIVNIQRLTEIIWDLIWKHMRLKKLAPNLINVTFATKSFATQTFSGMEPTVNQILKSWSISRIWN